MYFYNLYLLVINGHGFSEYPRLFPKSFKSVSQPSTFKHKVISFHYQLNVLLLLKNYMDVFMQQFNFESSAVKTTKDSLQICLHRIIACYTVFSILTSYAWS
jgi:hypothetical protein